MNKSKLNIIPYSQIYSEKKEQRENIQDLNISGHGKCIHLGKISPGCKTCFKKLNGCTVALGTKCNTNNCTYCINNVQPEISENMFMDRLASIYHDLYLEKNISPYCFSITHGEPLLYMDRMEKVVRLITKIENKIGKKIWKKIYSNGLLFDNNKFDKLEAWGISEIRFHTSATNFSEKVLINLEEACRRDFVVNVEEPAYPPNRKKLLNALSDFEEAGIDHMQIGEIKVFDFSLDKILEEYPEARFYLTDELILYHEGLTYEIMKEVSERNYSYSVLDCSAEIAWMEALSPEHNISLGNMENTFAKYPNKIEQKSPDSGN